MATLAKHAEFVVEKILNPDESDFRRAIEYVDFAEDTSSVYYHILSSLLDEKGINLYPKGYERDVPEDNEMLLRYIIATIKKYRVLHYELTKMLKREHAPGEREYGKIARRLKEAGWKTISVDFLKDATYEQIPKLTVEYIMEVIEPEVFALS